MGVALAREAFRRGADVVIVHGPVKVKVPRAVRCIEVTTAEEMRAAVLAEAYPSEGAPPDIVIMAAAVAAVILSQLPREQAGQVLMELPPDRQGDLVVRIAALAEIPAQAVEVASEALARALAAAGGLTDSRARQEFDGVAFAAGLLNELPRKESERVLSALTELDGKIAPKVRDAMFTFEDLSRLGVRDPRILDIVVGRLALDPAFAAALLAQYGDPAALPYLHRRLGMLDVDRIQDEQLVFHVPTMAKAIEDLGGQLSPSELFKARLASTVRRNAMLAE